MFKNVLYHWSLVHISFLMPRVKIGLEFDIVNHKGEGHEKQIVSDSMNTLNDYYLKFCILCSIVLTIRKVCRLDFLQVSWGRCGKNTITLSETFVNLSQQTFVCV